MRKLTWPYGPAQRVRHVCDSLHCLLTATVQLSSGRRLQPPQARSPYHLILDRSVPCTNLSIRASLRTDLIWPVSPVQWVSGYVSRRPGSGSWHKFQHLTCGRRQDMGNSKSNTNTAVGVGRLQEANYSSRKAKPRSLLQYVHYVP